MTAERMKVTRPIESYVERVPARRKARHSARMDGLSLSVNRASRVDATRPVMALTRTAMVVSMNASKGSRPNAVSARALETA